MADGLAATAKVISAAAAIMVFVFGAFILEDDRVIKLMGTGLAVAILLDATIVRMLLVPSTMELLGDKNWWIPRWLDRILPNLDVEGHAATAAVAEEPAQTEEGPPALVPIDPDARVIDLREPASNGAGPGSTPDGDGGGEGERSEATSTD